MQIVRFFLALILFLPLLAQAQNHCKDLAATLAPSMIETFATKYRPLTCSDNIKKFGDLLQERGLLASDALIVHIRHKWAPYYPIIPSAAKLKYQGNTYKTPRWGFHAIAVIDGLVVDLDFTEGLRITGADSYFRQMWKTADIKDYVIQTKPLADYKGRDLYGVFDEALYPSQTFESATQELSHLACAQESVLWEVTEFELP